MPLSPEVYLISSIIRDRDYSTAIAHGIAPQHLKVCQDEWNWIERYYQRHKKVPSRLAFKTQFPSFRIKEVNDTGHFTEEVRKSAARTQLMAILHQTTELISEGKIDQAVSTISARVMEVAANLNAVGDSDVLADWESIYRDVESRVERFERDGMAGIPTGFETLDERTGGVQPGQHWVFGARLGEGKSWALSKIAATSVAAGKRVHFAALEMSRVEVTIRIHSFLAGPMGKEVFKTISLMQGKDFDIRAYRQFLREMKEQIRGALHVSDTRRIGAVEIAAQIERNHPDIYILDYLTLAQTRGDGGWQDIGQLSKELLTIAGEYNVAMVSAAQLNRLAAVRPGSKNTDPAGADTIGQADAIGQDATAVITLRALSESVIKMKTVKFRHGPSGYSWHMHFEPDRGIFTEVSANEAGNLMDLDADRRDIEAAGEKKSLKR